MANLSVQPLQNQPTLNPKVVTNPVQPKLAPKVVSKPVQPVLSPKVVTNPAQPNLSPVAASQPANLPQINVDNSPRFVPLGEQVKLKYPGAYDDMDSGELGKTVAVKYPGIYDQFITPSIAPETKPQGVRGLKGVGLGFLKEVGQRVSGGVSLAQKALELIPGSKAIATPKDVFGEKLKQQGTAEKIGGGIENVAEFFIPGGAVTKAGKAIETGVKGLEYGSKATKALQLAGKVGLGATEAGVVSKVQGQSNKDALINSAFGGALPLASAALAPLKNSQAGKFINSLIKPKEVDFRFGKNPGQAVAEAGIIGNTLQGLKNNIGKAKQAVGKEIEKLLTHPEVTKIVQDVSPALSVVDDAINTAVNQGEQEYVNRLLQLRNGLTKTFKLVDGKLEEVGLKKLELNPLEIQKLKIQVGEGTRWTGQAFDSDINQVKTRIYSGLNDLVEKAAPGSKKLNSKYGNLLTAEKAAEKRIGTASKNNLVSLPNIGLGGTGIVAGTIASGGAAIPGILAGAGAVGASKVLGSTAVKSRVAKQLAKPAGKGFGLIRKTYFGTRPKKD